MQDIVRSKLAELVGRFGPGLCDDAKRCEAILRDVCNAHKREILALVCALREDVGTELRRSSDGVPKGLLLARLTKRLHENAGIAEDLARWAVESWALALGVATAKEFRFPFKCPVCGVQGTMVTRLAGQKARCPKCSANLFIADNGREVYVAPEQNSHEPAASKTSPPPVTSPVSQPAAGAASTPPAVPQTIGPAAPPSAHTQSVKPTPPVDAVLEFVCLSVIVGFFVGLLVAFPLGVILGVLLGIAAAALCGACCVVQWQKANMPKTSASTVDQPPQSASTSAHPMASQSPQSPSGTSQGNQKTQSDLVSTNPTSSVGLPSPTPSRTQADGNVDRLESLTMPVRGVAAADPEPAAIETLVPAAAVTSPSQRFPPPDPLE